MGPGAGETLVAMYDARARELTTLLEITRDITSNLSIESVLREILEKLKVVVDFTNATIVRLEGETFVNAADYRQENIAPTQGFRFPASNALDREVMRTRRPLIIPDVRHDDSETARDFRRQAAAFLNTYYREVRTWMRVPLISRGNIIGMLTLHHDRPGRYGEHDAELAMVFAGHAAIAMDNARLYRQARELAALEERQKLARELHDSVSQALYGIALGARTARTLLERDPAAVGEPLEYIVSLAEAGLAEMRALIFELRPESLRKEGLVAAIRKQTDSLQVRYGLVVEIELGEEPDVDLNTKEAFYRIAQEALHNIVRHARAGKVQVRLAVEKGALTLQIEDDGVGFDAGGDFPGHLGLRSMRERIEGLGGEFRLESSPGEGTRIQVIYM